MPDSLLDWNQMTRNALGVANLYETRRMRAQQEEQNLITRRGQELTALMKLTDDPRVSADPTISDAVFGRMGDLVGVPKLSVEAMRNGREEFKGLVKALADKNPEKSLNSLVELLARGKPEDTEKVLKSFTEGQQIPEAVANLKIMRQLNEGRFEKIHADLAKVNAGQVPFADATRDFSAALRRTDDPGFLKALEAGAKAGHAGASKTFASATARSTVEYLDSPAFQATKENFKKIADAYSAGADMFKSVLDGGMDLPSGVTRRDVIEGHEVRQKLADAYKVVGQWAAEPYNKGLLKEARAAQTTIETELKNLGKLKEGVNAETLAIRREALTFRQSEAGVKHAHDANIAAAQSETLGQFGRTPSEKQLADVAMKHGVKPEEILPGLADPSKKGKLAIDINAPTVAMRSEAQKGLTNIETTKNIITNLKETISQTNIGFAAALKSTAYGFTAQIQGLAQEMAREAAPKASKDFHPNTFFDPSLSTVALLTNTLAYRLVNIEQGGRISDKDIAEMRKRLNIDSLMAGKEDAIQRLTALSNQLDFEAGVYRRLLPTFNQPGTKPVGEMSIDEQLNEIKEFLGQQ